MKSRKSTFLAVSRGQGVSWLSGGNKLEFVITSNKGTDLLSPIIGMGVRNERENGRNRVIFKTAYGLKEFKI